MEKGFTLIEVMIAAVLVALAITGLVGANRAFTMANGAGVDMTTTEFLIEQIREMTAVLPTVDPQTGTGTFGHEESTLAAYDDVDDFDGASFNPPIDAGRSQLADLSAYTQVVTVQNVNASNFEQVVTDHSTTFYRVKVEICRNGHTLNSANWLRSR
jgi:prepilin-type N-terminal cleavage/methylation domain-containing protein